MAIVTTQLLFSAYSAFSSQEIYDGYLLNTFNVFFTSIPILAVAIFHREMSCEDMEKFPQLYNSGIRNTAFNYKVFWSWLINSLLHGFAVFYFAYYGLQHLGMWTCSIACYSYLVVTVNMKLMLTTSWNNWIHFCVWGSIIVWICFASAYNAEWVYYFIPQGYYTFFKILGEPSFYLGLAWIAVWGFLPDFIWISFKRNFYPQWKHIIQEQRQTKHRGSRSATNDEKRNSVSIAPTNNRKVFAARPPSPPPPLDVADKEEKLESTPLTTIHPITSTQETDIPPFTNPQPQPPAPIERDSESSDEGTVNYHPS